MREIGKWILGAVLLGALLWAYTQMRARSSTSDSTENDPPYRDTVAGQREARASGGAPAPSHVGVEPEHLHVDLGIDVDKALSAANAVAAFCAKRGMPAAIAWGHAMQDSLMVYEKSMGKEFWTIGLTPEGYEATEYWYRLRYDRKKILAEDRAAANACGLEKPETAYPFE
jgi:hypothetical protein